MNWISANEQLPPKDDVDDLPAVSDVVLVAYAARDGVCCFYALAFYSYPHDKWIEITSSMCGQCDDTQYLNVTHWQPLPASPIAHIDKGWVEVGT